MKKIFFIHIAKTGGSSFNAFLKRNFMGEEHCESYLNTDGQFGFHFNRLRRLDYISGHLSLKVFDSNNFLRNDYFLMAFLRNPIDQLISHLNWVIHIYDLGKEFFSAHPQEIQALSLELRTLNLYDANTLISILQNHQGFRNNQSAYFADTPHIFGSEHIIEKISCLDMVGITELYRESLEVFIDLNSLTLIPEVDRENINLNRTIGRNLLKDQRIFDFLQEYNAVDIQVYNHFKSKLAEKIYRIGASKTVSA